MPPSGGRSLPVAFPLSPWFATLARAADPAGAGGGTGSLSTVLFLLGVVAAAFLLAHYVVERAQQRFLFVSGAEYLGLGVLLGPFVLADVQPFRDLTAMGPIFAFAAGWVGLLYGLELELRSIDLLGRAMRLALADTLVTGVLVAGSAGWLFTSGHLMPAVPPDEAWLAAGVLGCAAAAGSSSAVDLVRSRYADLDTQLLPMLRRTARLGDLLSITVFGVLFCVFHEGRTLTERPPAASDWILLTVGLGLVLGLLFVVFIGNDQGENNVFLAMVGILMFASGAAFFLNLSALLVNLLLGVVLVQTAQGAKIRAQLERTAKPASLVLLLFAGAHWEPVPLLPGLVVAFGFLGLRLLGKVGGTLVATVGTPVRGDLFRGLMAQGDAAVAMALSAKLVYDGPAVNLAYTAILAGVVVNELVSPRLLRGLLVDAGELREDLGPAPLGRS